VWMGIGLGEILCITVILEAVMRRVDGIPRHSVGRTGEATPSGSVSARLGSAISDPASDPRALTLRLSRSASACAEVVLDMICQPG
jgi:hypothetical protein